MINKTIAADRLREMFPVGSTARTKVLHVSRSGMSRTVAVVGVDPKTGEAEDVSYLVAAVTGMSFDRERGGVKVGGTGMDMAFHVVYSMSRALYPDGHRCTGHDRTEVRRNGRKVYRCPSNDHSNDWGNLARQYAELHPDEYAAEDAPGLTQDERHAARVAYVSARRQWISGHQLFRRSRRHSDGGYAINKASL